ncbi:MAG: undecaprenyl-diphosphate phosphatase, partial [Pseudomonadota bacterium]
IRFMHLVTSICLGIIQGLTEFLPISSSGHLVFFQTLFGVNQPELLFDTTLHLGTLVAICIYFRSDLTMMIRQTWGFAVRLCRGQQGPRQIHEIPHAALTLWVLIGTIPTALIGILFRSQLERLFGSVLIVGLMLIVTGMILVLTKLFPPKGNTRNGLGLFTALAVGTAQGIAIIPGISRSGATIVCGMVCGVKRDLAARFSFILSIPAIMGAMALQLHAENFDKVSLLPLFSGFATSLVMGLFALKILMNMVRKGNLALFAPYCWLMGLVMVYLKFSTALG